MRVSGMDGSMVAGAERRPAAASAWPLAALALCVALPSLGISIAHAALPTLAEALGASFQQVQWVVLAYLLATTTLAVSAGRLGDIVGRRRLLLGAIVLFTAASALCAAAGSLWLLVAARALQGTAAAVMTTLAVAFVADTVPKAQTGSAMGLLGTMSAVGTALGPTLGGGLIATLGWPSIFLLSLPLGAAAWVLAWQFLPADGGSKQADRAHFDVRGTVLLALSLAAYALAMTLGRGHMGMVHVALLGCAALGGWLFVRVQARAAFPLVRLASLRDAPLRAGLATSALVSTVVMATLVVGPFYLARALHLGAAGVGMVMSIGPAVAALVGVLAGRLVDRLGAQRVLLAGLAGMLLGCTGLVLAPVALGVAGYAIPMAIVTAGYALFQTANNTAVMKDVAADQRGVVSGLLNLSRNLGLITGASVMGAVFAFASGADDFTAADPLAVAAGLCATFAVAAALVGLALVLAQVGTRAATRSTA